MTKKANVLIGLLIVLLIVCIVSGFFVISILKSDKTSSYFNKDEISSSKILYDKVMSISEEHYPSTPEQVILLYTEGYKLLYGNKIKDMSIVPSILQKQRILFSDEILSKNSLEQQTELVLNNIKNLQEQKVKITSIEIKQTEYDSDDNNIAYVRVEKKDNFFQTYYYIYHLKLQVDKWRITGWYNTDKNFNIIQK